MINELSPLLKWRDPRRGGGICFVQFQWVAQKNATLTAKHGRPIFDNVLLATVQIHSSNKQKNHIEVERWIGKGVEGETPFRKDVEWKHGETSTLPEMTQRMRFEECLAQWEKMGNEAGSGTPLETWGKLDVGQIAMLKSQGVNSIEGLASIADSNLPMIGMGSRTLRDQAVAYLNKAEQDAPITQLQAQNAALQEQLAAMQAQMAQLAQQGVAVLERKKPGPKPRVHQPDQPAA